MGTPIPSELEVKGICIDTPAELQPCLTAAEAALDGRDLRLKCGWLRRRRLDVEFVSSGARPSAFGDGRELSLLPWFTSGEQRFWVAIQLIFQPHAGGHEFERATIAVATGVTGPIQELLRAEWEDHRNGNVHAQPHWHIYSSTVQGFSVRPYDEDADSFFDSQTEDKQNEYDQQRNAAGEEVRDMNRFHFAMSARWPEGTYPGCKLPASPDGLAHWLAGSLRYTRTQLHYLCK